MTSDVKFIKKFENGRGIMGIYGSHIMTRSVDFLPDFFAAYRKLIQKRYGISVCGNFYAVGTQVKCVFMLDLAYAEKLNLDRELYIQKFADTFCFWTIGLESILRSILHDIEDANKHTEEPEDRIRNRIFSQRTKTLKLCDVLYNDTAQQKINQLRAERKAANARRKAAARAKKAAQQNSSHQD